MRLDQEYSVDSLPESIFEPVPAGTYDVIINEASGKENAKGTGSLLVIKYEILGPACVGRVIFDNLNIRHQNKVAEQIGLQNLNALLRAVNVPRLRDTDQLLNKRLKIQLVIKEGTDGERRNNIKGYEAVNGPVPAAASTPARQAATTRAKAAGAVPKFGDDSDIPI